MNKPNPDWYDDEMKKVAAIAIADIPRFKEELEKIRLGMHDIFDCVADISDVVTNEWLLEIGFRKAMGGYAVCKVAHCVVLEVKNGVWRLINPETTDLVYIRSPESKQEALQLLHLLGADCKI